MLRNSDFPARKMAETDWASTPISGLRNLDAQAQKFTDAWHTLWDGGTSWEPQPSRGLRANTPDKAAQALARARGGKAQGADSIAELRRLPGAWISRLSEFTILRGMCGDDRALAFADDVAVNDLCYLDIGSVPGGHDA